VSKSQILSSIFSAKIVQKSVPSVAFLVALSPIVFSFSVLQCRPFFLVAAVAVTRAALTKLFQRFHPKTLRKWLQE
jgi:hypothetical protein